MANLLFLSSESSRPRRQYFFLFALILLLAPTTVSTMLLQGKRVLVTGAGRGIGRAIALICQDQGAQVAVASRTASQLEETVALAAASSKNTEDGDDCDAKGTMLSLACDVTNPTQVESMVQKIVDQWGGLDILINNAGGAQPTKGTVESLSDPQELMQLLQLNVVGVHMVTSTVLRLAMKKDGHILNISSKAGKVGLANMSFYVASKFALEGLTATWAKELEEKQIVVNSISPGMVDTQSFPKAPGRPGVRSAESIEDGLMMALTAPMKFSGHYVHVDELDMVRKCELPDWAAWKKIDEEPIEEFLPPADF
jgi:meso-butanediol dehydrogenase/(S,S)-butanediol dehydrogenase/diacetyl reductase